MNAIHQFKRHLYKKRLQEILSHADDEAFLQMLWAVDALQSGRPEIASPFLQFPPEAASSDLDSKFAIRPWELETLIVRLLTTPKYQMRDGPNRVTNCGIFAAIAKAIDHLRELESAESAVYLTRFGVLNEMHRIAQRTFPWQRGYHNVIELYRYAYLYGQGECSEYFERTNALSVNEFSLVGFGLCAAFQEHPWVKRRFSMDALGVAPTVVDSALKLFATTIAEARIAEKDLVKKTNARSLPTAFQPSLLRRFPIISFGSRNERLRAPLPHLITPRTTSGIYYDLISGPARLRNEAAKRFESYSAKYIQSMLPSFCVKRSYKYRLRGNVVDTPDIFVTNQDEVVVVIECKATKLTFGAQFAEDPMSEAKSAYDEIVKGVFQIWRYFSHVRRGLVDTAAVNPDACGMILTLDTWLDMSRELQEGVIANAVTLASDSDPEIIAQDRRSIIFCAIQELEQTLLKSDEASFMRTLSAACERRFKGWHLSSVHQEVNGPKAERKDFPFDLCDVLPWWAETDRVLHREPQE